MSLRAMLWALELPIENVGAKFVLVALAEHAGDHNGEDWQCYPSVERLGKFTSQKARTIERHLIWLWSQGVISRERRQVRVVKDAKKGVYNYTLHWKPEDREALRALREAKISADANLAAADSEADGVESGSLHPPESTTEPAKKAGTIIDEPPIEPVIEPSACAPARDVTAASPPALCETPSIASAVPPYGLPGAAGADDQARWHQAQQSAPTGEAAKWLAGAYVGALGQSIYLVVLSDTGADELRRNRKDWPALNAAWRQRDPLERSLQLISRKAFARLVTFPAAGAA